MLRSIIKRKGDGAGSSPEPLGDIGAQHYDVRRLPVDVLEHVYHFLTVKDVVALSLSCKLLRAVAASPRVWADLVQRTFLYEELPQDLEFLRSCDTALIRSQFWQLTHQRPAFLSDAPRTSEILEHTGSRFRKVLHVDGRRDFNFTTVFRDVPPGQYNVVWRLMLQPGYVRGYCNFRAVFSRPAVHKAAKPTSSAVGGAQSRARAPESTADTTRSRQRLFGGQALKQGRRNKTTPEAPVGAWRGLAVARPCRLRAGKRSRNPAIVAPLDEDAAKAAVAVEQRGVVGAGVDGDTDADPGTMGLPRKRRPRRPLRWLPSCISGAGPTDPQTSRRRDPGGQSAAAVAVSGGPGALQEREAARSTTDVSVRSEAAAPASTCQAASSSSSPSSSSSSSAAPAGPQVGQLGDSEQGTRQPALAQQQQQGQDWPALTAAAAVAAGRASASAAGQHADFPEIEPVLPLQQQPESVPAWQPPPLPRQSAPRQSAPSPQQQPQQQPPVVQRQLSSSLRAAAAAANPQPQLLQRAMSQLASASAKRDAALAAGGGPRYVPRWLSPLWGGHACSWRQLDPSGPLGHGLWRSLQMGTLTVRRRADAHLHGVMVQLRPANPAQQELALPPGETRWRGALVDYVELVPVRNRKLLGGLLRGLLQRSSSPVVPEVSDVVEVPRL